MIAVMKEELGRPRAWEWGSAAWTGRVYPSVVAYGRRLDGRFGPATADTGVDDEP